MPSYTTADLAERVHGELKGRSDLRIEGVNALKDASEREITFITDQAHAGLWAQTPKRGEETQRVIAAIREQAAKDLERKNPADRVFRGCGDEYLKKLTTKEPENSATWDDDDEFLTDLTNLDYLTDHEWQKLISRLRPTFKP